MADHVVTFSVTEFPQFVLLVDFVADIVALAEERDDDELADLVDELRAALARA